MNVYGGGGARAGDAGGSDSDGAAGITGGGGKGAGGGGGRTGTGGNSETGSGGSNAVGGNNGAVGGSKGTGGGSGGSIDASISDGAMKDAGIDVPVDHPLDTGVDTTVNDSGPDVVRSCDSACATAAMNVALPGDRFTGSTIGASLNAGSCGGATAPEAVYQLVLTETSDVFVTTHGSTFDTVIYMRRGCCGTEIACNDNADGRNTSMLNVTGLTPGTYDIFVDGAGAAGGAYTVDIYASPSSAVAGDSCGRPIRLANSPYIGNSCAYRDDLSPPPGCGTHAGPDGVFYFVLDAPTTVTFDTCSNTCIDTELYIRDVCTSELVTPDNVCSDDGCMSSVSCLQGSVQSMVTFQLGPGAHYVVLDSFQHDAPAPSCGLFTVTPSGVPQ